MVLHEKIFGFCLVFLCCVFPFFNDLIVAFSGKVQDWKIYREALVITFSWFPLLDSIVYRFTKSFKRNLLKCIWNNADFDTTEEALKSLREEELLSPQVLFGYDLRI